MVHPKTALKEKCFYIHQKSESYKMFPAQGNKTSLFATASTSSPLSWPYRRTKTVYLRNLLFFHPSTCLVLQAVLMFCCTYYTIAEI